MNALTEVIPSMRQQELHRYHTLQLVLEDRLMRYGATQGREDEVAEHLFRAYFLEGAISPTRRRWPALANAPAWIARRWQPTWRPMTAGRKCCGPTAKPGRPASTGCRAISSIAAPRYQARRRRERSSRRCWRQARERKSRGDEN